MRHRSATAEKRAGGSLRRRLDAASASINPFLMMAAVVLFIIDLACGVAIGVSRLPVTRIAPPPAQDLPAGSVPASVQ